MYTFITCLWVFVGQTAFGQTETLCKEPKDYRLIQEGELKTSERQLILHTKPIYTEWVFRPKRSIRKRQMRTSNAIEIFLYVPTISRCFSNDVK